MAVTSKGTAVVTHDGREVAFHGEYWEIVPNERIVHTAWSTSIA